jgi:hypothetical protein
MGSPFDLSGYSSLNSSDRRVGRWVDLFNLLLPISVLPLPDTLPLPPLADEFDWSRLRRRMKTMRASVTSNYCKVRVTMTIPAFAFEKGKAINRHGKPISDDGAPENWPWVEREETTSSALRYQVTDTVWCYIQLGVEEKPEQAETDRVSESDDEDGG